MAVEDKRAQHRWRRIERLLKWARTIPTGRHRRDPWEINLSDEEKRERKTWPIHAPELPEVDLEYVMELARATPYEKELREAVELLRNPRRWEVARTDTVVPASRLTVEHAETLRRNGITREYGGQPLAWGLLSTKAEPEKMPPRHRAISDMLWSNATLDDAMKVKLTSTDELLQVMKDNRFGVTFDFTGWYYSLPVSEEVQPYLCFRVGKKVYTHVRAPMGHKWMVMVAHTITKVLAHTTAVCYDVIIDNVLYAGNDELVLCEERKKFLERCARARATVGEATEVNTTVTYRGIKVEMGVSVTVKQKWADKLRGRIQVLLGGETSAAKVHSVGGMIAWLRGVLPCDLLDDYWLWRLVAVAAQLEGEATVEIQPNAREALRKIHDWILDGATTPRRALRDSRKKARALIVTDASQARPLARWGALVVTDRVTSWTGLFPIPFAKVTSIADLETAAILLTLELAPAVKSYDILALTDNQVTHMVMGKRRCSAWRLHSLVKAIHRTVSVSGGRIRTSWIPTDENPADNLSRGRGVSDGDLEQLLYLRRKFGMDWEGLRSSKEHTVVSVEVSNAVLKHFLQKEK